MEVILDGVWSLVTCMHRILVLQQCSSYCSHQFLANQNEGLRQSSISSTEIEGILSAARYIDVIHLLFSIGDLYTLNSVISTSIMSLTL